MAPVFGYWKLRGLAQPSRLMLKYAGVEFEDKRYVSKGDPQYNAETDQDWLEVKFTLGLDFPNLPYYIDGNVKLTQSTAILRYLARKYNLYGSNDHERAMVDVMSEQIVDIIKGTIELAYHPKSKEEFEEKKKVYEEKLPEILKPFEEFLGDKQWLIGDQLTYVDFHWYEILNLHTLVCPGCLENFPKLKAYHDRFEQLPAIKAYMESDEFIQRPIYSHIAYF